MSHETAKKVEIIAKRMAKEAGQSEGLFELFLIDAYKELNQPSDNRMADPQKDVLIKFAQYCIETYCWGHIDPDGGGIQEKAEQLGLIQKVTATEEHYDSEDSDFAIGDEIYIFAPILDTVLTLRKLKGIAPGTAFATGEVMDTQEDAFLANTGRRMKWIAVKGHGHDDWCIYAYFAEHDEAYIKSNGNKIGFESHIQKCVPCDAEALARYRR